MPKKSRNSNYHVPNLERGLQIMELLSERPEGLTKTEIVAALGLPANSVYRITSTLINMGYLQRDARSRKFHLTGRMMDIGQAWIDRQSLVETAWDTMLDLRDSTRETVLCGALCNHGGVVLEQAPGLHPVTINVAKGTHFPLHATAPGKCLLAFMPGNERDRMISEITLQRMTSNTITSKSALKNELGRIRTRGWSTDKSEIMEGIHCVAAPVFGRDGETAGAIWVVAPSSRMPQKMFNETAGHVIKSAKTISGRLGFRGETP
jgi:DNA-binding IclR family transcriptional regulator